MTGKARRGPTWISPSNSSTRDLQRRAGLPLISALHEPQWAALRFPRPAGAGPRGASLDPPLQLGPAGLAGKGGPAVDLRAARAAVGRLAVPPDREVRGLLGPDAPNRVENDPTLADR